MCSIRHMYKLLKFKTKKTAIFGNRSEDLG